MYIVLRLGGRLDFMGAVITAYMLKRPIYTFKRAQYALKRALHTINEKTHTNIYAHMNCTFVKSGLGMRLDFS